MVDENRLELISPLLVSQLKSASPSQLRAVSTAVCRLAIERTHLTEQVSMLALRALEAGDHENAQFRSQLEALTEKLDTVQWDLRDEVDLGKADYSAFIPAFGRARAANALFYAFHVDPFVSASEAIYEVQAAIDDIEAITSLILATLGEEA